MLNGVAINHTYFTINKFQLILGKFFQEKLLHCLENQAWISAAFMILFPFFPNARQFRTAKLAISTRIEVIIFHIKTSPGDNRFTAYGAMSILQRSNPPRQVAGIDIMQTGFLTDFRRALQG